jgi:hypothetical protein
MVPVLGFQKSIQILYWWQDWRRMQMVPGMVHQTIHRPSEPVHRTHQVLSVRRIILPQQTQHQAD